MGYSAKQCQKSILMIYELADKKLIIYLSYIPYSKSILTQQAKMPSRTFKFPSYDTTIELTDSNTVKWVFKDNRETRHCCNEFNNTDIPDSFGGIANFYHIVVALHESYLNGKSNIGTLIYKCDGAERLVSIRYNDGIKLECDVKLCYPPRNSMETETTSIKDESVPLPTEDGLLRLPVIVEDKPYYIQYSKEIANLLPDTLEGTKINKWNNSVCIFACKNLKELQTHFDVFRKINPKFTYENLATILVGVISIDDKREKGICILPSAKPNLDYIVSWTKKQLLCDEINRGLKQLAYYRMLAEFK
jgi:hypothetical protein